MRVCVCMDVCDFRFFNHKSLKSKLFPAVKGSGVRSELDVAGVAGLRCVFTPQESHTSRLDNS